MNEAFIRHLERASEIVSTWPEWKQNLLGRRIMNQVDQAARRAAEAIIYDVMENPKPGNVENAHTTIAAEFAPLQERLVEAERLLKDAKERISRIFYNVGKTEIEIEIDKFLAKKENGNG